MDMLLEGANSNARITTEGRSADYTQYYNHDALDVHTYTRVTYHDVYPGIDWVVYTTEARLPGAPSGMKYDFVLRSGADPANIQLLFKDQTELRLLADGSLLHGNPMGRFTEEKPVSFQNGKEVGTRFVLNGDRLSFALDNYDRSQPLTIDPARIWGTYYGGTGSDFGSSCTVDSSGNVYLAGTTGSTSDIASAGHENTFGGGDYDAFLVKFDAAGVRQWGTYYGGSLLDVGYSCAVDGNGNAYLAGSTNSSNGIAYAGHQNTFGGEWDAFLVKFDASGMRQWSTYYGGMGDDRVGSYCAVDGSGNVYLPGYTYSPDAIASGGHQNTLGGEWDAFLVKFNAAGLRQWGTYYGGSYPDFAYGCVADGSGNVYLSGFTLSSTAIASGGHQNTIGGSSDAFLVKFDASGVRQWGTYYGGPELDSGQACAVDDNGNVYLAGYTSSSTAIASSGQQNTSGGNEDAFLVKFDPDGIRQWGTYYGGTSIDYAWSCAVDSSDNVFLAGNTSSTTAIASGGHQNTYGGGTYDGFLVKFSASGVRQWATYYGGLGYDDAFGTVANTGNVYLAGSTGSSNAIAADGHQGVFGGGVYDAFLVKFEGDGTVGLTTDESDQQTITIWPNPNAGDRFFLQAQGNGLAEVQLFDAMGKLQFSEALMLLAGQSPVEVALGSHLAKGLYMVQMTWEGQSHTAPLLIE